MDATNVVGRRVGAVIIDYLIGLVFNGIVFFLMADTDADLRRKLASGEIDPDDTSFGNIDLGDDQYSIVGGDFLLYLLITFVFGALYWWVLPGLKGWTPGKLALGLRVVRDDGTCPAGIGKNALRSILWIVDDFPYIIPALTGFIVALTNKQHKRVGDMVAGTLVVSADSVRQGAAAAHAPGAAQSAGPVEPAAPVQPVAASPQPPAPAPQPPAAEPEQPADWYPDPHGEKRLRYWDGSSWTEHTAD